MKNLWSDNEAKKYIQRYTKDDVPIDLALRVYSSHLLGNEPKLVLHGGGNTSVKTIVRDFVDLETSVLCVKGSGWDLGNIEPAGLPAVRLEPIQNLQKLKTLSDENMVNIQRANLLNASSPNPSVETLLHAFLPHKFIDHTHSNAVLALSDQKDGEKICRDLFGDIMGFVPYIMPGFLLAKEAARLYRTDPSVKGLILLNHGIFTFAQTAKESYNLMIKMVSRAERYIKQKQFKSFLQIKLPIKMAKVHDIAPILRGVMQCDGKAMIMDFRTSPEIRKFVCGKQIRRYAVQGTATPDHVIRIKQKPFIAPIAEQGKLDKFARDSEAEMLKYVHDYKSYFNRNNKRFGGEKTELDPIPRMILVPGVGVFGLGNSAKSAEIAADLIETNISIITAAESIGTYNVISEEDIFDMEYWSLEQAKLGNKKKKLLESRIVVVTGGASGIGEATAKAFKAEGAEVFIFDKDNLELKKTADLLGVIGLCCDVTNEKNVDSAFNTVIREAGGVDIVVSNAGAAWQGKIGDVNNDILRKSFELNFWSHQIVAQNAVRVMRLQNTGGCLLFNTSKQAINPGRDFGPYGLPKAATLFLMKQYALDYAQYNIRSNAVNADRIRSGLLTSQMIKERSKARGVNETEYMSGNLLKREVKACEVAKAFVDLATSESTTAAIITVDGGNIEASLR